MGHRFYQTSHELLTPVNVRFSSTFFTILYSNVSNMMRELTTQNWLMSRHKKTTKDFYVKTKAQL